MNFSSESIESCSAYSSASAERVMIALYAPQQLNGPATLILEAEPGEGVAGRLLAECNGYSETFFNRLANEAPDELLEMVRFAGLRPARLTFAAEALGQTDRTEAIPLLLQLAATNPAAIVREGAIYGLLKACAREAAPTLEQLSLMDPSPGVREAAASALELL